MAFSNISTYVVRAVTWPSDCDDFCVNLQSREQATEDVSACMIQSSTETVPSASKTLPCQIVFHVFFGVMEACKEMEEEPCPEIPLLAGHGARWRAEGLQAGAALCLAVCLAGCWEGVMCPAEFPWPRKAPLPLLRASPRSESRAARTKPAAQQLAAWD